MINTSYSEANTNELIPEGVYEFKVLEPTIGVNQNGKGYVCFPLKVRDDVNQGSKGRVLYHYVWKKKPENLNQNDRMVDGHNFASIMAVLKNCGIPEGTSFETLEQMVKSTQGKAIRGQVAHDQYNGKMKQVINTFAFTTQPMVAQVVNDNDLPF